MKNSRSFSRPNRILSFLRFGSGLILISAAAAMAFVAVKSPSPPLTTTAAHRAPLLFNKFRQDPDEFLGNKVAKAGPSTDRGPTAAAEEAFANRAYPATDIPFTATLNAQSAFSKVKARGNSKKNPAGQWSLIGPSSANFPNILTFSGAAYTTSGRITALAIAPNCGQGHCYLYVAAAGGGIWRTDKALHTNPSQKWDFLSGSFATNAIGALIIDPTDPSGNTLYAGTGEPNVSVDSEAGVGIYKTTDGGNTWTHLASQIGPITTNSAQGSNGTYTGDAFAGRAIQRIAVDPTNSSVLYVTSARGVRGVSSTDGGPTGNPPTPRPPYGLFKSTDGGATFSFIWDGNGTNRGVIDLALDPSNSNIVYASALNQGTWRSTNSGATFSHD